MKVFLIGYRGTGKTTVASLLAERLGWPMIDADEELERRAGRTIAEIFEQDGEAAFRDLESQVVASLCEGEPCVVSLGGGAVMRPQNRQAITPSGRVIWLQATPDTIQKRLAVDATTISRRPNLTTQGGIEEIRQLLTQREPIYRQCADLTIDTEDKTPRQVANEILRHARNWGLNPAS